MLSPIHHYCETYYTQVDASTTDYSDGEVIPNGQEVSITSARVNGAEPTCYVAIAFDFGGDNEKIFVSSKGDVELILDVTNHENHVTGDGTAKLQVVIVNDNASQTPIIGGAFCATKI